MVWVQFCIGSRPGFEWQKHISAPGGHGGKQIQPRCDTPKGSALIFEIKRFHEVTCKISFTKFRYFYSFIY